MHVPRHRHSPRVRWLAREAGVDPDTLAGTGPNGRVRPVDVVAGMGAVSETVAYVAEVDLGGVPDAVADRHAVVAAIVYALLHAVRRRQPVTDVEVESESGRVLIRGAHDFTRVAIADRIRAPRCTFNADWADSPVELIVADGADAAGEGGLLRVRRAPSGCLLSAVIGPTIVRAVTYPGPAGLPTIEFRPLALLAISTGHPALADSLGLPWRLGDP